MMLMHVAWTMWVDRGQGGGCAPPACTRAEESSIWEFDKAQQSFIFWEF